MKLVRLFGIAALLAAVACGQRPAASSSADIPVYLDPSKTVEERVEDALARMTTKEKVALRHAQSNRQARWLRRQHDLQKEWQHRG